MQISGAWLLPCLHVLLLFLCTSFVALLGSIVTSYHLSPRGAVLACHVGDKNFYFYFYIYIYIYYYYYYYYYYCYCIRTSTSTCTSTIASTWASLRTSTGNNTSTSISTRTSY